MILKNFQINKIFSFFFVFFLFVTIFSIIQFSSQSLAGADAYYHIKYAYLIRTEGLDILKSFPWMQFSIWNEHPADLSFFYHILLIPFTFGNLIVGSKLSAILFSSLVFTAFYWVLKKSQIKHSFLWTILLFSSSSVFIFRMTLPRAFVLSVLFSILAFYLISKRNYFWLFILSIIFTLTHSYWPFLIVFSCIFLIINYFRTKKIDYKLLFLPIIGISLGLILRPDFPQNLHLFFAQIFSVFYYKTIGIDLDLGMGMQSITDFANFTRTNLLVLICFVIGFISCLTSLSLRTSPNGRVKQSRIFSGLLRRFAPRNDNKNDKKIILYSLFFISLFFFFLTLKANRFVEYWVPFTVMFGAFGFNSLQAFFLPLTKGEIKRGLINTNKNPSLTLPFVRGGNFRIGIFIKFFTAITLLGLVIANISYASWAIDQGMKYNQYKDAAEWLAKNTPPGSIVFNTNWGDFPQLFFYNHHNYYIIGMDPTFMYVASPEKYWLWRHISEEGIICSLSECDSKLESQASTQRRRGGATSPALIYQTIKQEFKAEYIFISDVQRDDKLRKVLEKDKNIDRVFSKDKIEIYKLN